MARIITLVFLFGLAAAAAGIGYYRLGLERDMSVSAAGVGKLQQQLTAILDDMPARQPTSSTAAELAQRQQSEQRRLLHEAIRSHLIWEPYRVEFFDSDALPADMPPSQGKWRVERHRLSINTDGIGARLYLDHLSLHDNFNLSLDFSIMTIPERRPATITFAAAEDAAHAGGGIGFALEITQRKIVCRMTVAGRTVNEAEFEVALDPAQPRRITLQRLDNWLGMSFEDRIMGYVYVPELAVDPGRDCGSISVTGLVGATFGDLVFSHPNVIGKTYPAVVDEAMQQELKPAPNRKTHSDQSEIF